MIRRKNCRYELLVLLALSIGLNVVMYRHLSRRRGIVVQAPQEITEKSVQRVDARQPQPIQLGNKADEKPVFNRAHFEGNTCEDGVNIIGSIEADIRNIRNSDVKKDDIIISPLPPRLDSVSSSYNWLQLKGVFKINETYSIVIRKGTRIIGEPLQEDYVFMYKVREPKPSIDFATEGPYYPATVVDGKVAGLTFPCKAVNINEYEVTLYASDKRNLDISPEAFSDEFWYRPEADSIFMNEIARATRKISIPKHVTTDVSVDISNIVSDLKPGFYKVEVRSVTRKEGDTIKGSPRSRFIVLSDIGISCVLDVKSRQAAVVVKSLASLKPIANADISLFSLKRSLLASGKTTADGTMLLDFSACNFHYDNRPFTIVASKGDDVSFLRLEYNNELVSSEFDNTGNKFSSTYYGFAYTERGIYRPGEVVHAGVVVRQVQKNRLVGAKLTFPAEVFDSNGASVYKTQLTTNGNGYAVFQFETSPAARTGTYSICCKIGTEASAECNFIVGAFTPDSIKVTVTPSQKVIAIEEQPEFAVEANYYFGQRLENGRLQASLNIYPMYPREWNGYSVGSGFNSDTIVNKNINLEDFDGKITFDSILSVTKDESSWRFDAPVTVSCDTEVTEPGGTTVFSNGSMTCLPARTFLGLKNLGATQNDANIEIKALHFGKEAVEELREYAVRYDLVKITYDYVEVHNNGKIRHEWKKISENVLENAVFAMKNSTEKLVLKKLDDGEYKLTIRYRHLNGREAKSILHFWHYKGEPGTVRSSNPKLITVTSDKERYFPGETAKLSFYADGEGAGVLVQGDAHIDSAIAFDVKRGLNVVEIPISHDTYTSRYYASLTVVFRKNGNFVRTYAVVSLALDQEKQRMKVEIAAPEKAVPAAEIDIAVRTSAQNGSPVSATVHVFAVDEGVLALTDYKTPGIFDFFHGCHYCDFRTYDIYGALFPNLSIQSSQKAGGGFSCGKALSDRMLNIRQKENAVVDLGLIETGDKGAQVVKCRLPKHLGAMRIMAVASGKELVGCNDTKIVLRDKASVKATLPAAVACKDVFEGIFVLFNHDLDDGAASLKVTLPPELKCNGTTEFKCNVARGKSVIFNLPLQSTVEGIFTIGYVLEMGEVKSEDTAIVNVRSIMPFTTRHENAILHPGETMTIEASSDDWTRLDEFEATLSASPVNGACDALEWLNKYPYGCLEQTTSTAFPLLAVDNLIKAGIVGKDGTEAAFRKLAKDKIEGASIRLLSMKLGRRGFAGWPDSSHVWLEPSVYAAHFLFKARSQHLSESAIDEIKSFLEERLDSNNLEAARENVCNAAYAAYVISLVASDRDNFQHWADKVLSHCSNKSMSAFFIGAALYNAGYAARGVTLVKRALEAKCWNNNEDNMPWLFYSEATRMGIILSIGMEIIPTHEAMTELAFRLAELLRTDGSCWGETNSNAMAVFGLAAYAVHYPNGIAKAIFSKGDKPNQNLVIESITKIALDKNAPNVIKNTGDSSLYVHVKRAGIPVKLTSINDTVGVMKEYLDMDGKPVSTVRQGDLINVVITFKPLLKVKDAVVLDLIPGGFAIEDGSLATRSKLTGKVAELLKKPTVTHQEILADRFIMFGSIPTGLPTCISYRLRAVSRGTFAIAPTRVEDMYAPDTFGSYITDASITVK